jgi:Protein of unknown function (DUF1236)
MRILLILVFVVFSLGAMATFDGPETSSGRPSVAPAMAGTLTGAVKAVRTIRSHLKSSDPQQAWLEPSAQGQEAPRLSVGEVLPEGTVLYEVPRHQSYRYAVLQGQRVIVDAASRQIVYVIR